MQSSLWGGVCVVIAISSLSISEVRIIRVMSVRKLGRVELYSCVGFSHGFSITSGKPQKS